MRIESASEHHWPLVVIHIPRTGGTSIIDYFHSMQSKLSVCPGREDFEILTNFDKRKYDVYVGHIGIDFLAKFDRAFVATFMRDPLSRMFSMWNQIRRTNGLEIIYGEEKAEAFEAWCRNEFASNPLLFNQATLLLSYGRHNKIADNAKADEQMFALASENIGNFAFVGLTENYDAYFQDFLKRFELPWVDRVHSNYIVSELPLLTDIFMRWFEQVSAFDYRLYALSKDIARDMHLKINGRA